MYIHILFHVLFHYDLLQSITDSSLCCMVGPCLSILYSRCISFSHQNNSMALHITCFIIYMGLGVGNGKPLQYSCLENSMDREAWWAAVHGVTESRT